MLLVSQKYIYPRKGDYLFLKKKASEKVSSVLSNDLVLAKKLIALCTHYIPVELLNKKNVSLKSRECAAKDIDLTECRFAIDEGIGKLTVTLDMKNFVTHKKVSVHIDFSYQKNNNNCASYYDEISNTTFLKQVIPHVVFYGYLPFLQDLACEETCHSILEKALTLSPGGFVTCPEWIDL